MRLMCKWVPNAVQDTVRDASWPAFAPAAQEAVA
jgi:hypothetical protein